MENQKEDKTAESLKLLYKVVISLLQQGVSEFEISLTIQLAKAGFEGIPKTN